MKKTVVFLVLVVTLAGAGYYGSAWYGTHQMLKRAKSALASVGVLDWQAIQPGLSGDVRIEELRLIIFKLNQPVRIGSAVFDAGSPQDLVRWLFQPEAGWPALAQLALNDMQLVLQPDLSKSWVNDPAMQRPWHLRACGDHRIINASDLMAMGVTALDLDATLRWKKAAGAPTVNGEVNAGALGSLDFIMSSDGLPKSPAEFKKGLPLAWQSLQVIIRDGGFMRRLAAFCSKGRFDSPEAWAQAEAKALQQDLGLWGVSTGSQLVALYRQWMHEGGAVSLELPATPSNGLVSLEAVARYLEQDNLAVLYNDRRLADFKLSLSVADLSAQLQPPAPIPRAPTPAPANVAGWLATPPASLDQWLDRRVRITLSSGRSLEGRLSAINGRQLQVARIVEGGEFAATADREDVVALEVWRRRDEIPVVPAEPQLQEGSDPAEEVPSADGGVKPAAIAAEPIY